MFCQPDCTREQSGSSIFFISHQGVCACRSPGAVAVIYGVGGNCPGSSPALRNQFNGDAVDTVACMAFSDGYGRLHHGKESKS